DIAYNGDKADDWKVFDQETAIWRELKIPVYHFQAVHRRFEFTWLHLHQDVVIVDFFTLEQIARGPRDRIGVSAAAARDEVGDAAVLVTFIVVHMSGEDHDARAQLLLLFFEISGEFLFRRACAV